MLDLANHIAFGIRCREAPNGFVAYSINNRQSGNGFKAAAVVLEDCLMHFETYSFTPMSLYNILRMSGKRYASSGMSIPYFLMHSFILLCD